MTRWTRERIVDAIQEWTATNGRAPGCRDWEKSGTAHPSYQTVRVEFGSLDNARQAAGVSFVRGNMEDADRETVVAAVYRWRFEHGCLPRENDWRWPTPEWPGRATVRRLFGSWNGAIVAAGYEPRTARMKQRRTKRSYRAIAAHVTKTLHVSNAPSPHAPTTVRGSRASTERG